MRRRLVGLLAAAAALAFVAAGCGSDGDGGGDGGPSAGEEAAAMFSTPKGVPRKLAANREQAGQILEEGSLQSKLDELRGHPIVVNQWASWCDPCRAEFPHFRDAAEQHAGEVAFLGIDMQDNRGAAERWLAELPVPYPHIWDPQARQIASLGGGIVSPTTVFIDEKGEIINVFQGQYVTREHLEEDIGRHLLG